MGLQNMFLKRPQFEQFVENCNRAFIEFIKHWRENVVTLKATKLTFCKFLPKNSNLYLYINNKYIKSTHKIFGVVVSYKTHNIISCTKVFMLQPGAKTFVYFNISRYKKNQANIFYPLEFFDFTPFLITTTTQIWLCDTWRCSLRKVFL